MMSPEKIADLARRYMEELEEDAVEPERMDEDHTFESLTERGILSHALYLAHGILKFVHNPEKYDKANRHLTAIQMCLSFAGRYMLKELMEHNRSTPDDETQATLL